MNKTIINLKITLPLIPLRSLVSHVNLQVGLFINLSIYFSLHPLPPPRPVTPKGTTPTINLTERYTGGRRQGSLDTNPLRLPYQKTLVVGREL